MRRKSTRKPPPRTYHLQVVLEVDEDGKYVAWCPSLKACYSQGDTFEEALENIRDVIAMCLEELLEEQQEIDTRYPEVIGTRFLEVTV